MDRILFGDNQFFGINHISDAKSRQQQIQFKDDKSILKTIDFAMDMEVETFMCTTHDRIKNICDNFRMNPQRYQNLTVYPCMPYAHKYANAITELGILGTLQEYMPGNLMSTVWKGGVAMLSKDYLSIMKILIDAEMKMFKDIHTPVIFLQNVVTDLLLGLGMKEVLKAFHDYIQEQYNAEAGFITMNLPMAIKQLNAAGIYNPIICTSFNKAGFRMPGGIDVYEKSIRQHKMRLIAMQIFGGGAINPKEAIEYICSVPNITSILFGASSKHHIADTIRWIHESDKVYQNDYQFSLN
jgi:hypothetical protein